MLFGPEARRALARLLAVIPVAAALLGSGLAQPGVPAAAETTASHLAFTQLTAGQRQRRHWRRHRAGRRHRHHHGLHRRRPSAQTSLAAGTGWNPPAQTWNLNFDPVCNTSQWDGVFQELGTVTIVHSPVAPGQTCAALFSQGPNTTGSWRRIELQNHVVAHGAVSANGGEAWYQFRIYPISSGSGADYSISQFRETYNSCYTGGVNILPGSRHFRFSVRGGSYSSGGGCTFPAGQDSDLGSFNYDQWYTFQFHYIWSPDATQGLAEVWLNGTKVVTFHGPTSAVGAQRILFRTGVYAGNHSGTDSFVIDGAGIYAK